MINILYCIPALYNAGGMERILTEKANYLANQPDFKIHVLTTDQKNKDVFYELSQKIAVRHLNLDFDQYFDYTLINKYLSIKKLQKKYKRILEEYCLANEINIIVSLGGKELDFLYKLNTPCTKICELHFSIEVREQFMLARGKTLKNRLIGKFRTYQMKRQTKCLDKLIVLTKSDEEKLKQTHKNVVQIYNFSSFEKNDKVLLHKKNIVAVGKLDPQKGFDLLIDSCKNIENWNNWVLHIYGEGPDKTFLEKKVKDNNLQDHIFFMGVNTSMEMVYINSSLFVLSSRYEGFPMVLLEAISFGIPLVSFDCETGPKEIIKNNDCGLLVENGQIRKLGKAIEYMINNQVILEEKSLKAFTKSNEFSKDKIMREWIQLFKNFKA